MDTIGAGGTVAFVMECYENGILTKDDLDGLDLTWGNTDAILKLIDKMIKREGIGDLLADGTKVAAKKIGKGSEKFVMHAGGQELPMHDGRNDPGYALHYSVEPTPGRHTIGSQIGYEMYQLWKRDKRLPKIKMLYHKDTKFVADEKKAIWASACSRFMNVVNGSGMCWFGAMLGCTRVPIFDWINAATGWNKTGEEYMDIGERIQTTKQAFNIKHGVDPKTFRIKDRIAGKPLLKEGANKGRSFDIDAMMNNYWQLFGWDSNTGKPKPETLKRLGIGGN
jgi:aldehyde:ferredoxin oxidoreductase